MKRIYLSVVFALCISGLTAQTRTTTKSRTATTKKQNTATRKTATTNNRTTEPASIRDRINQRLKDSAAAVTTSASGTTVINGITVPTGTATATTTSTAGTTTTVNMNATAVSTAPANNSSTTTGGNSVTNTGSPMQGRAIPGTIPVTPTNAANIPGKPTTQEQTKFNATDVSRTQMNAINGNQVASAAQNPDNTTRIFSNNMVGESQWGTNQVGENQWTPPSNIIEGFIRDFPAIRGATWTRDNNLNTFSARYRNGDLWTSSTYNMNGVQVETRTELPLLGTLPDAVTNFKSRQSALTDFNRISRIERPGRQALYEVRLTTGRVAYLNSRGEEVPLQ